MYKREQIENKPLLTYHQSSKLRILIPVYFATVTHFTLQDPEVTQTWDRVLGFFSIPFVAYYYVRTRLATNAEEAE